MPLSAKQLMTASLLSQGFSQKEIAVEMQITPRTIQRWRHDPEFQESIATLTQQTTQRTAEVVAEVAAENQRIWLERQQWLRQKEWEAAEELFEKALTCLRELELSARLQNIGNAFKIASELGRKSSELWNDDLNAAIALILRFGYKVKDDVEDQNDG